ncbi:MAG: (4Fe-4S)-binding protein [bacterium (Candidatus Stahlbacteria) CG08_land_8_20_14_0_20_40_26]|nr:MAG: (4Fe-4S)-binding protein [bacterium (Candidatus Stahlbacteria) CG23_combo_of_CG06-09_8_20_14_all_40_9]PIS23560.1 MAG: (4Fe-4S)-binding protein [bacterium (Candidatus Stahlbacteria) CG08_land_8_20_14_0_20_40_26]
MKQIVVISGKGGTGKTIITASFASLSNNAIAADCDVDAADLHLLLHPEIKERHRFKGLPKAEISQDRCTGCGRCYDVCRFDAVQKKHNCETAAPQNQTTHFFIDHQSCEGCKVCYYACPEDVITMRENVSGEWYVSETKYGPMVHARLGIAEENSGKLVTIVRENARSIAEKRNLDFVIVDGPPGIGCPVIASLSGVDIALVVTEPTLSGIHDMERVIDVARHFGVETACIINKYDINLENSKSIENWCNKNKIPVLGKIPFDNSVSESVVKGVPIVEYTESEVTWVIKGIWQEILKTKEK